MPKKEITPEEREKEMKRLDKVFGERFYGWMWWRYKSIAQMFREKTPEQRKRWKNKGEWTEETYKEACYKSYHRIMLVHLQDPLNRELMKYKIEHPQIQRKDLAEKFGVERKRAGIVLRDYKTLQMIVDREKENDINKMYDEILRDVAEITQKNIKKYKNKEEMRTSELKDLSSIAKDTMERKNLMNWDPTSRQEVNITIN